MVCCDTDLAPQKGVFCYWMFHVLIFDCFRLSLAAFLPYATIHEFSRIILTPGAIFTVKSIFHEPSLHRFPFPTQFYFDFTESPSRAQDKSWKFSVASRRGSRITFWLVFFNRDRFSLCLLTKLFCIYLTDQYDFRSTHVSRMKFYAFANRINIDAILQLVRVIKLDLRLGRFLSYETISGRNAGVGLWLWPTPFRLRLQHLVHSFFIYLRIGKIFTDRR